MIKATLFLEIEVEAETMQQLGELVFAKQYESIGQYFIDWKIHK